MEKLGEIIKIIMKKHLISSLVSIFATITTYVFFPLNDWLKLETTMFFIYFFIGYFLLIKFLVLIANKFKCIIEDIIYKIKEKKEEAYIITQNINEFYDRLSPQDKDILSKFVETGNKILVSFDQQFLYGPTFLQKKHIVNVTDYTGNIQNLYQIHYWILPEL